MLAAGLYGSQVSGITKKQLRGLRAAVVRALVGGHVQRRVVETDLMVLHRASKHLSFGLHY